MMKKFLPPLACVPTLFLLALQPSAHAQQNAHPLAPDWQLKTLSGQPTKLSDYKGKVVILNFWATWCQPCRAEIPGFAKLQKKYESKGLTFIGVSMDEGGTKTVAATAQKLGINYPVVMGNDRVAFVYGGIEYLPTTFVLDRAGRVMFIHRNAVDAGELEAEIKPLL